MNDVWISGANGLLGSALCKRGHRGFSRRELDITDHQKINALLEKERPRVLINAAAQANVNLAEVEPERSFGVNAVAVDNLAQTCSALSIRLIHISTDYVLDEPHFEILHENIPTNPQSTYAKSKLMGEQFALKHGAVVIRVQWMYGCGKAGFFAKALRRLYRQEPLTLVHDQIGSPTPVDVVAEGLDYALEGPTGLYHLACSGAVSAENWIATAAKELRLKGTYTTTDRASLSTIHRPSRSCLGNALFKKTFGFNPGDWEQSMLKCLQEAGRKWLEE